MQRLFNFLSLFLFIIMLGHGQHIHIKGSNHFIIEEESYQFKELESILITNQESADWYQQSIKANKSANTLGIVSLGSLGLSFVAVSQAFEDGSFGKSPGTELWGILTILVPITGMIALVNKGKAIRSRKNAIDAYNVSLGQSSLSSKPEPYFSLQLKTGTLSASYHF